MWRYHYKDKKRSSISSGDLDAFELAKKALKERGL